jgi:ATP-binding cassette subfamily C (CFTR/MRP) protein 1
MASDFEANMVAVERVEQYSNIQSEADRKTPTDSLVPVNWPEKGEIQFIGSKLRYRQALPLVLKGLDIHIPAGAKVGIVGRTGAGKSTLMVAMLRIVELCEGKVIIDGVDHSRVGLAKLRSKIAVIPQDPVLFSGTIRSNLDPFEQFPDDKLLDVLERVGLYSSSRKNSSTNSLSSLGGQIHSLHDDVADSGSNYSVGQRQLLVIASALLCGSSIVIMDEATAAVDADTDSRIQKVMRNDFRHATCLTVAHRINTILDSDYILVMSDGQAAEFDTPQTLMDRGGLFRDLVEAAGREGDMARS